MPKRSITIHIGAVAVLLIGFSPPVHAQHLQLDHCSCTQGGTPSDSTFTFRGRMSAWNGNPTFRIWRVGTNRMLGIRGICAQSLELGEYTPYFGLELWADFAVSALTQQQPGVMQFVCIGSIKAPYLRKRPAP
ncbi:MAG: hypothetical protein WEC15_02740 [Flavobacteriales bacterium]